MNRNDRPGLSCSLRVVFFDKRAEAIGQYVKKGRELYVEGRLQTRKWQDQEGKDRYTTEVILQGYNCNLTLLDSRNQSSNSIENQSGDTQENTISDDSFDANSSDSSRFILIK